MWRRVYQFFLHGRARSSPLAILCLLADDRDRSIVAEICQRNQWDAMFATTRAEAAAAMDRMKPQVVLLDRDAGSDDWRDVMHGLASSYGGACILLISKVIDDSLWNEVVCNGGYEVIAKPLRRDDVSRAIRLARSYRSTARK